jgi:hypothetical protein
MEFLKESLVKAVDAFDCSRNSLLIADDVALLQAPCIDVVADLCKAVVEAKLTSVDKSLVVPNLQMMCALVLHRLDRVSAVMWEGVLRALGAGAVTVLVQQASFFSKYPLSVPFLSALLTTSEQQVLRHRRV